MTSGLAWDESDYGRADNSFNEMLGSTDPYRFVLERPLQVEPGTRWNYSGGDTQLLAGVLQRSTGRWLIEFARSELFEPIGIKQFEWAKMAANGEAAAGSGLRLRPRDMAKIGLLVLNRGRWSDHQIVPENWIEVSTRTHISGIDPNVKALGYGYQWWTYQPEDEGHRSPIVIGLGYGGQRIYIVPALDLVVAITAGLYDSKSQDWVSYDLFDKYVLGAIEHR
jgi:CubicO group peptidase (beta-lactamase class C family)